MPDDSITPRYYVYILLRPDGRAIYVGKGTKDRVLAHEAEASRGCDCYKCRAIRKVWRLGGEITRSIVFRTNDEDEAFAYEKQLVSDIGLDNLTNIAEGGRVPATIQTVLDQKANLASRSEGSIYRRKDGRIVGSLIIHIDSNGKVNRRTVYGKTQREVEEKLELLREERDQARLLAKIDAYGMKALRRHVEEYGYLDKDTLFNLLDIVEYCRSEYRAMQAELDELRKNKPFG